MLDTATEFTQQGYAVFPDALSAEDLALLRGQADELYGAPVPDASALDQGSARRFLAGSHTQNPALEAFLLSDRMAATVATCLGTSGYLFFEQFVVKGAHKGGSFAWHQDSAYVGFDHAPYLSVWIALDDATLENGCVYILPRDLEAQPGIDPHEKVDGSEELNGYFGADEGLPMVCTAGTIVAFSSRTFHRSGPNSTAEPRRAYLAQYSPEPLIDPATGAPKRFAKKLP